MAINLPNYERQTEILNKTTDIQSKINAGVGKTPRRQVFTSSGTWTAPAGVTKVFVTGGGGGGGGGFSQTNTMKNGNAGGVTSFGSLLSLSGGGGGNATANGVGEIIPGASGGPGGESGGLVSFGEKLGSKGGNSGPFFGGTSKFGTVFHVSQNGGYCSGGGVLTNGSAGSGGGGDFVFNKELTVSPGVSYPITIGLGGAGGFSSDTAKGGSGGNGILILEWWE